MPEESLALGSVNSPRFGKVEDATPPLVYTDPSVWQPDPGCYVPVLLGRCRRRLRKGFSGVLLLRFKSSASHSLALHTLLLGGPLTFPISQRHTSS